MSAFISRGTLGIIATPICTNSHICNSSIKLFQGRNFSSRVITGPITQYRQESVLGLEALKLMTQERIHAITIPNFINLETCQIASQKLLTNQIKEYTNAPGIGRIGIAFFETTDNPAMEKAYFDEAIPNMKAIRSIFSGESPIDQICNQLNTLWPKGATIDTRNGKKMFAGLCRSLNDGQEILPHEDVLERDDPSYPTQIPLQVQIAANIYLQVPKLGGELELYGKKLQTEEYDRLRKESYGINRNLLQPPMLRIKPSEGDLVFFNARYLHAVAKVQGATRLTISCFIGYRGDNHPLKIWS